MNRRDALAVGIRTVLAAVSLWMGLGQEKPPVRGLVYRNQRVEIDCDHFDCEFHNCDVVVTANHIRVQRCLFWNDRMTAISLT